MTHNGKISANVNGAGESGNGKDSLSERNEKGQFKSGNPGGPGRGKRKPSKPMTYEDIELLLQPDLKDSDPKVRHTATRLLIALKNKMPGQDNGPILDPIFSSLTTLLWEFAGAHLVKTGQPISMIEAIGHIKSHMETCPDSPMSAVDDDFKEITDDDTDD
jgi:hypothetical protein